MADGEKPFLNVEVTFLRLMCLLPDGSNEFGSRPGWCGCLTSWRCPQQWGCQYLWVHSVALFVQMLNILSICSCKVNLQQNKFAIQHFWICSFKIFIQIFKFKNKHAFAISFINQHLHFLVTAWLLGLFWTLTTVSSQPTSSVLWPTNVSVKCYQDFMGGGFVVHIL